MPALPLFAAVGAVALLAYLYRQRQAQTAAAPPVVVFRGEPDAPVVTPTVAPAPEPEPEPEPAPAPVDASSFGSFASAAPDKPDTSLADLAFTVTESAELASSTDEEAAAQLGVTVAEYRKMKATAAG